MLFFTRLNFYYNYKHYYITLSLLILYIYKINFSLLSSYLIIRNNNIFAYQLEKKAV